MDASTFAAARLSEHQARERDRDIAHLAAQAARREALGVAAAPSAVQRMWRRVALQQPAPECASDTLMLAGPSA